MRIAIWLMASLVAGLAGAQDLGNTAPAKPATVVVPNVPNPGRQGGDTIMNANSILGIPYSDSGTTVGYNDDYDVACPYTQSTSPDVVYRFTPAMDLVLGWDLIGSDYDTKLYVYDSSLNVIACNDDYYSDYTSRIDNVFFAGGQTYYIVIDGYGGDCGNYVLQNTWVGPSLECPSLGVSEGEPPLANDYVDTFNGGCNTPPEVPFQTLQANPTGELILCGTSGWYAYYRDTDWFQVVTGSQGVITIEPEAELPTTVYELGPQNCEDVGIVQEMAVSLFDPETMTITGYEPGEIVWVWFGPTSYSAPGQTPYEFDYVAWFSGLEIPIAAEAASWSAVKALYGGP